MKKRVLIVDDEVFISESLNAILISLGYEVTDIAFNKNSAINSLINNKPDIAILDIKMHGKNEGFEIADYINNNVQIPFLFLTSFADESTIKEAAIYSPDGYLLKPFNEKDIFSSIEIILNKSKKKENFIVIKEGEISTRISVNQLKYVTTEQGYIEIHTDNKRYVRRDTIDGFLEKYELKEFFKLHRSYAVNLNSVDYVKGNYAVIDEVKIPISRSSKKEFMQRFENL